MKDVDAMGLSCPEPVIMTKKALKDSPDGLCVHVDNTASKENVARYLEAMGCKVEIEGDSREWIVKGRK